MIKCHLSRLMGEKILRVADIARDLGIHRNTITLLYDETATRVDLETLNKLCIYLNCQLEELLEFVPDETK